MRVFKSRLYTVEEKNEFEMKSDKSLRVFPWEINI